MDKIDTKRLDKKIAKKRNVDKTDPYTSKGVRAKDNNFDIDEIRKSLIKKSEIKK
jgi:hypothetical protein